PTPHHPSTLISPSLSFFLLLPPLPPRSTLFPYTTLFRSPPDTAFILGVILIGPVATLPILRFNSSVASALLTVVMSAAFATGPIDRKSTRLNSSHVKISYAVFCLKKKKK